MDEARKQLSRLADLAGDVSISLPGDLHNLHYDAGTGKWVNSYMLVAVERAGGDGTESVVTGGSLIAGYVSAAAGLTAKIEASGDGGMAVGCALAALWDSSITSRGLGSLAVGYSEDNDVAATGDGAFAGGYVNGGDGIAASGNGSMAFGVCVFGIFANGLGSVALGYSNDANIEANGEGSVQVAPGLNAQPHSLQVGSGVRLCSQPPTTYLKNGDMWVDTLGRVCIRSAGVTHYLPATSTWSH